MEERTAADLNPATIIRYKSTDSGSKQGTQNQTANGGKGLQIRPGPAAHARHGDKVGNGFGGSDGVAT